MRSNLLSHQFKDNDGDKVLQKDMWDLLSKQNINALNLVSA